MKKVLHILPSPKRKQIVENIIDSKTGEALEHNFLYLLNEKQDNVLLVDDGSIQFKLIVPNSKINKIKTTKKLVKIINKYDFAFVHYYLFTAIEATVFLFHIKMLKKMAWVTYCGDLYENNPKNFRALLSRKINNYIKSKFAIFIGIFPTDIKTYNKLFPKSSAKKFYAHFFDPSIFNEINTNYVDSFVKNILDNNTKTILIGHNGRRELNHIEILKKISRFKDKDIKIIIPMIEGEESYINLVKNTAFNIFGTDKIVCFDKPISRDDYYFLLKHVDVAIFDIYRPMAIGNIVCLILNNAKLFFPNLFQFLLSTL